MHSKRIGFVDHHLDNFHAKVYLEAFRGPLADRGYVVSGAFAQVVEPSRQWAAERDLPFYSSVDQLQEYVDYVVVLAPSNPDVHLELCRRVFPWGKPTFVDKTFAPDLTTAEEIFALADRFDLPVQSTSALRYTNIQADLRSMSSPVRSMHITAAGPTFSEYGIHPVELAVSCLGPQAEAVMKIGSESHPQFVILFSEDRSAIIDFNSLAEVPYGAVICSEDLSEYVAVDTSKLFVDAAAGMLEFFDAGKPLIDRRETLAIRQILDIASNPSVKHTFSFLPQPESQAEHIPHPHWKKPAKVRPESISQSGLQ